MGTRTSELANPDSCFSKAAEDEPLFVLRANDELAPDSVREWAWAYRRSKRVKGEWHDERVQQKFSEALTLADAMQRWKTQRHPVQSTVPPVCARCKSPAHHVSDCDQ